MPGEGERRKALPLFRPTLAASDRDEDSTWLRARIEERRPASMV
jgi:hypothetical protein